MVILATQTRLPAGCLLACALAGAVADDTGVLPRGVSSFYWDLYHYYPTTQRYNADGEREALAAPFSNATLDDKVLTILPPGSVLGEVAVDYEYDIDWLDIGYAYGVSDNLSIGFHVPYYWIDNNVDIEFDNSTANLGLGPGGNPAPIGFPGVVPFEADDIQDLIQAQYGFDRVDSWSRDGIGDIELGARYRCCLEQDSALAFTGGLRLPTGEDDHADKLNDVSTSYGTYALLFRLHYDYLLSNRWKPLGSDLRQPVRNAGDLLLNLTLRVDYMLPDDKIMRIGDTPEQVFTNNRERVDRELGDIYNLEFSTRYWHSEALSYNLTYTYGFKSKDDIDGDMGFNYSSLETDTDFEEQIIVAGANYSTLAAYRDKRSRAPLDFSIAYRERFAGKGPMSGQTYPRLYTRWVVIAMTLLFR